MELLRRTSAPSASLRDRAAGRGVCGGGVQDRLLLTIHDYPLSARLGKATAAFWLRRYVRQAPATRPQGAGDRSWSQRGADGRVGTGSSMGPPPQTIADRHIPDGDRSWHAVTPLD